MSNEVILDKTDLGRPRVIAVDYDGTLYHHGNFNYKLINALIKFIENGNEVALWTCRSGESLEEAVNACRELGLEFSAVNENTPQAKKYWAERGIEEPRKLLADQYIDDLSIQPKWEEE